MKHITTLDSSFLRFWFSHRICFVSEPGHILVPFCSIEEGLYLVFLVSSTVFGGPDREQCSILVFPGPSCKQQFTAGSYPLVAGLKPYFSPSFCFELSFGSLINLFGVMGLKNKSKNKLSNLHTSNKQPVSRQKVRLSSAGCSTKALGSLSSSFLLGDDQSDLSSYSSHSLVSEDSFSVPSCAGNSKEGASANSESGTVLRHDSEGPLYHVRNQYGFNLDGLRQLKKVEVKTRNIILKPTHLVPLEKAWGHSFVGFIAGSFPGFGALKELCNSWNVENNVYKYDSGWIVFNFQDPKDRDKVFQGGPYQIYGRPLILMSIPPCFEFDKTEMLRNVPVWVKLPGLPMDFRSDEFLSELCSIIGTPICADAKTSSMEICNFARVLVEIDASQEPIETIHIVLFDGKTREQQVVYEFVPKFCSKCNRLGHSTPGCDAHKAAILKNKEKKVALAAAKDFLDKDRPGVSSARAKDTEGLTSMLVTDSTPPTKSTVAIQEPAFQFRYRTVHCGKFKGACKGSK